MKVFGIGLSKTGTKSLGCALKILGYKSRHFTPGILSLTENGLHLNTSSSLLLNSDAFFDIPVSAFYKDLDKLFPGSKFILSIRDIDQWLDSCQHHFMNRTPHWKSEPNWWKEEINGKWSPTYSEISNALVYKMYGTESYDEKKFISAYERHLDSVKKYFRKREDDLLIYKVDDEWSPICHFLNVSIPDVSFPTKNVRQKK